MLYFSIEAESEVSEKGVDSSKGMDFVTFRDLDEENCKTLH